MNRRIPVTRCAGFYWILLLTLWGAFTGNARPPNTSVVVWENSGYDDGLTNVPAGLVDVAQIAVGDGFCLALNDNGTVVAWGTDDLGETNVPTGLMNIVAVSAGGNFALALDNNGNIYEWGDNSQNQAYFPQTFSTRVGLAAGDSIGLVRQSDGTVSVSGVDTFGQANIPSAANSIVAIAAGFDFDVALRSDGTVVAWGNDLSGGTDVPAGLTNVVAIAAEGEDGFALQATGDVVGWGADYYGQSGAIPGVTNIISISGDMALQSNGTVVPLGDAMVQGLQVPEGLTNVVAVDGWAGDWGMALVDTGNPLVMPTINETAYSGSSVLFTSSAVGAWPLSYQWQFNGTNLPGANRSWLMLTNVQTANAGSYKVTVTNVSGAATSLGGQLSVVNSSPIIVAKPSNMVLPVGGTAEFTVTVAGSQPLSYQWQLNNNPIPGGTNASILLPGITNANAGRYNVRITNPFGAIFSSSVMVTFAPSVVAAWGFTQVTNVPVNLTNAVEIASGGSFALALTANGSVVGWGDDESGEIDIPAGLTNVTQIGAYNYYYLDSYALPYSLALANGSVFAWGDNTYGECDVPNLKNAIDVLAGQIPMALRADGRVAEWGESAYVPPGLSNVIAIAEGKAELALQSDGKVVAWGTTYYGLTNVPPNLSNVVAIAAGVTGCLALSANGQITAWGAVTNVPAGLTNVVGIAAQPNGSIDAYAAVTASGAVVSWGEPFLEIGEHSIGTLDTNVPASITNAASVFLQTYGGLTLNRNGTVSGWGNDGYENAIPPWLTNGVAVSGPMALEGAVPPNTLPMANEFAYSGTTAILEANATGFPLNYQWQLNGTNIPGANQSWLLLTNVQTATPPLSLVNYVLIVSNAYGTVTNTVPLTVANSPPIIMAQPQSLELPPNNNFTFSVGAVGSQPISYQWQYNGTNIPGATGPSFTVNNAQLPAAGYYSVILNNSYGTLASSNAGLSFSITSVAVWGDNSWGELNVFSNLTDVLAVSAGFNHNMALLAGGTVVAWGDDSFGEIAVPSNLTNVTAIAAGGEFSLALRADGTVIGWGLDNYGQIDVPSGLSNVVAIAAGEVAGMALQSNGVVSVWGYSEETNVPSSVTNVVAIAATAGNCLVLRSDGTVVEWGEDFYDQTEFASTLTNIIALGSGCDTSCDTAVKSDGTVVVWGYIPYSSLEPPAGLSNVVAVAAGSDFCLAMLADRTAFAWGPDGIDALKVPPGLTNVTQIGCGEEDGIILDPAGGVITLVPIQAFGGNQVGYLQATLTPPAAVSAGGGWGIVGQPYFSSNTNFTVAVSAGQSVALAFQSVNGWNVPISRAVTVPLGGLTNLAISYSVEPPLMSALPGTGFGLTGTTNTTYRIQSSTNLASSQWLTLSTNTLGQGFNKVASWPPATHTPATYYRAVWLP
jgi:alpha-tubulin suppressor-like RCC1 family protein